VPLDSSESNAGEALRWFLDAAPIADDHVHPYDTLNADPDAAAAAYVDTIRDAMRANHTPQFDLVFLGMGDDGHTASLFPGTAAIHERERFVVSHRVEKLDATRLTFTPPLINAATTVVFLVGGAGKAATLTQVLDGPVDVNALPSQVIRPVSGDLEWIVDEAAAARLRRNDTHG
jgi:6-phosphogluconolactonase